MKNSVNHLLLVLLSFLMILPSVELSAQAKKSRPSGGVASKSAANKKIAPSKLATRNQSKPNHQQISNSGNKTNNIGSNNKKVGSNNKVSIDNSKKNINVNIDNSKHTNINNSHNTNVRNNSVRRNSYRPYTRPPYRYGGRSYYCHFGYHYHPYRPFYWGPMWHPWGFVVATLATTAIIISIENQQYHYDEGVYYVQSGSGYTVVQAPVGATITNLPPSSQTVVVNETTNNYYYGGTYYEKSDKGFTVVPPTAGTIVENLPEGAKEEKIGNQTYMKLGDVYYQPITKDGKDMYEVAEVDDDKS